MFVIKIYRSVGWKVDFFVVIVKRSANAFGLSVGWMDGWLNGWKVGDGWLLVIRCCCRRCDCYLWKSNPISHLLPVRWIFLWTFWMLYFLYVGDPLPCSQSTVAKVAYLVLWFNFFYILYFVCLITYVGMSCMFCMAFFYFLNQFKVLSPLLSLNTRKYLRFAYTDFLFCWIYKILIEP